VRQWSFSLRRRGGFAGLHAFVIELFLSQADFVFNAEPLHRNFDTTGFFRTVHLELMYSVYRLRNSVGEQHDIDTDTTKFAQGIVDAY
jgi:hypothetical protein